MSGTLTSLLGFVLFPVLLYAGSGWYVALRIRGSEARADRILGRAVTLMLLALLAALLLILWHRRENGPLLTTALAYAAPLGWFAATVLGNSHLEIRARGLECGLLRFARFNLFLGFLLGGQALPLLSAALLVPTDPARPGEILAGAAFHLLFALALGLLLRRVTLEHVVSPGEFPDEELVRDLRRAADRAGVKLNAVRQVPTERGQSLNALAATTSRTIYVAEGLREGLEREELRAVLLHEIGHFAQTVTNFLRNAAALGLPLVVWTVRAVPAWRPDPGGRTTLLLLLLFLCAAGILFARRVFHRSEIRADAFAGRWGDPAMLASALRKLYRWNLASRGRGSRGDASHPGLRERLALLEGG